MGGLEALKKRRDFTFDNLLIKLLVLSLPRFFLMACNNLPCRKIIYCFLNRLSFHDFFIFLCHGSVQLIRITVCSYKDKWCSLCSNFFLFPPHFLQATEEVSKNLVAMKEILYGTNEKEPQTEAVAQLAQELYNSGLLSTLVADLQLIDFEVRKLIFHILSILK